MQRISRSDSGSRKRKVKFRSNFGWGVKLLLISRIFHGSLSRPQAIGIEIQVATPKRVSPIPPSQLHPPKPSSSQPTKNQSFTLARLMQMRMSPLPSEKRVTNNRNQQGEIYA
jgi:hypothetical protein